MAAVMLFPSVAVGSPVPYVYQRVGSGDNMSVTTEYETAYGSRQSRFFGGKGLEQGLRVRFQPWSFVNVEGWAGMLIGAQGLKAKAASVEVNFRVLNEASHYLDLNLGAGYVFDYLGDHVPRIRMSVGRSFGDFHTILSALAEIPVNEERDEVDLMLSLAGSYSITPWYRQGLELCVEDMEGLWEPEESEGGAKFLLGPTAYFEIAQHFEVKLNLALVLAYLSNQVPTDGQDPGPQTGFMGRLVLGYTF